LGPQVSQTDTGSFDVVPLAPHFAQDDRLRDRNLRPARQGTHLLKDMIDPKTLQKATRRGWARCVVVILFSLPFTSGTNGQKAAESVRPWDPLPQDTGAAGLRLMLKRLSTTARLLHTTAHPDDEDGGMITLESRGRGDTVELLTLNRGEGGQNKVGSNLFDVLGVLRTLELTASDRYYGVEQRFTRVADFGFSKNPEETFQKWNGHDVVLADMVRVIRTFRPDVLVSRFQGTDRDGHGNHQASGIVSREAFRAAADAKRFPEQIAEGLLPWQAKKFYFDNVCPFRSNECPPENYTVKLSTGDQDPDLGMTYIQFAMEGLRHQLSQGAGGWSVDAGPHYAFYRLVDSVLPSTAGKDGHEQDFFDGIDTSLSGLAGRLGADEGKVPWLQGGLQSVAKEIKSATEAAEKGPQKAVGPLFSAAASLRLLADQGEKSSLGDAERIPLVAVLRDKHEQAERAVNLAMGISAETVVMPAQGDLKQLPSEERALTVVSPGQDLTVIVKLHNGSKYPILIEDVKLDGFEGWITQPPGNKMERIEPGHDFGANYRMHVPATARPTRPYWHRDEPERDGINTVDQPEFATLPFPPSKFRAHVQYSITGRRDFSYSVWSGKEMLIKSTAGPGAAISTAVVVPFLDEKGVEQKRPLAVAPRFSVMLDPGEQVIPVEDGAERTVSVAVKGNLSRVMRALLHLDVPTGWRVEPESLHVEFSRRGESRDFQFKVFPANLREGRANIRAVLEADGTKYSEGYSLVTREDLASFYYYQPAVQRVSVVDVKVPKGLKVGYIMGAGDDIPTVLRQVGLDVALIPAEKLASEDLGKYQTIVLGIRAYDTQKEAAANNKKLLDFVSAGGMLVVQYEADVGNFNGGSFAPYPVTLGRGRVSVEEAAVEMLAPQERVFHFPNEITQRDFDGWVQERGLYFMEKWDDKYMALLASHDPGEPSLKGGLLMAKYGKGTYIYTGYAFFRQLPAGVPGAVRLYVNLLAAGR
jgi:LmbE family N-acetylglucosaminyl deacetylase